MIPEYLAALPTLGVAYDCETHRVQPGLLAPPLVCGSIAALDNGRLLGEMLDKAGALEAFMAIISGKILIAANAPFDVLVAAVEAAKFGIDLMPRIFEAYEQGRIFDPQVAESLHAIGMGRLGYDTNSGATMRDPTTHRRTSRYSLDTCVRLVLGRDNAKANDRWRMSFALLENTPMSQWPPDALAYLIDDAENPFEVALAQTGHAPATGREHRWTEVDHKTICVDCRTELTFGTTPPCTAARVNMNLHDLSFQCYAHWALHLGAAWGFEVDQSSVDILEHAVNATFEDDIKPFLAAGILREDGSQNTVLTKRMVAVAYGAKDPCLTCAGVGKVPNPKQGKPLKRGGFSKMPAVRCTPCDGTGLFLTEIVPRTIPKNPDKVPGVGKGRDTLTESGDELLMNYAGFTEDAKIRKVYIPWLRNGQLPDAVEDEEDDEAPEADV